MALTTISDVAEMLRWSAAETTKYSGQLPAYIDAASQVIEDRSGPFEARTVQHIADGGATIMLPHRPTDVTSVEVAGAAGLTLVYGYVVPTESFSAVDGWTVNLNAGIVYGPFPPGRQNIRVTFTVGYPQVSEADPIPPAVRWAATALVCHMWAIASQRGPGLPEDYTAVPTGFLVPNAVKEALAPFTQMPGFA